MGGGRGGGKEGEAGNDNRRIQSSKKIAICILLNFTCKFFGLLLNLIDMITEKKKKSFKASKEIHETTSDANNAFVQGALKEMKHLEAILNDELAKHFSMQVDLRTYEEIVVKLDNGEVFHSVYLGVLYRLFSHIVTYAHPSGH